MRKPSRHARFRRFLGDVRRHTPFTGMVVLLVVLWLGFAAAIYFAERGADGAAIDSYAKALYWSLAAFSTAGIADTPATAGGRIVGGIWIVIGSVLFFGTIVATVTGYFMRPLQRPHKKIIETIEYNLEQLEELNADELDLLRETVDTLIEHVERIKRGRSSS